MVDTTESATLTPQQGLGVTLPAPLSEALRVLLTGPAGSLSHPVPSNGERQGDGTPLSALVHPTSNGAGGKTKLRNVTSQTWSQTNTKKPKFLCLGSKY